MRSSKPKWRERKALEAPTSATLRETALPVIFMGTPVEDRSPYIVRASPYNVRRRAVFPAGEIPARCNVL
ncbi:hypothetical protein NUM3379_26460 [Kineococcus sp. NUM-3379]